MKSVAIGNGEGSIPLFSAKLRKFAMSEFKTIRISLKSGETFQAKVRPSGSGWEAFIPHLGATGFGFTQLDAIVDAFNEASAGL